MHLPFHLAILLLGISPTEVKNKQYLKLFVQCYPR